ncbi:tryptophan halogenase family protein [Mycobacteroides salmoniphilum]|uniref:tryptophan halogenase family protein n=1 Tax=Mycobacteroides salmoniphilum TaxID=404941 RepID=UPI0010E1599E|nr:tryptophan halogenase family protein [Mycobacteroides salmoniphilum]TDZ98016.1 Flavin-dependent tryptophan halogenase RebH [Mycobacteroides salmoniphilum]
MLEEVVIVGGGTAGWMTASYLKVAFGDRITVTVVESERIGAIGVGEATFSTIRHFFEYLGLEEHEWMPSCCATYKLGIRFQDWRQPGHHFYHPFERQRVVDGFSLTDWWLNNPRSDSFDRDCFLTGTLCDNEKSPRRLDGSLYMGTGGEGATYRTTLSEQEEQFPYAYHFDASLLADFLRDFAVRRGVRHVVDDVVDVLQDDRGWISQVCTRAHGGIGGDLFIDCTGFAGLLLGRAMGEPFESYQGSLLNDRAVALRVPTDQGRRHLPPYTTATAQDAGWIWSIPLFGRIGSGYVYAADYCTPEDAERTLRDFVGPAAEGLEADHIRMRIGRSRRSWVRNCVAIGLASGFVEPLESTGIFFIQHGIEQLVKHFPDENWEESLRDSYNRVINRCMDGVREFLVLHYYLAARTDTQYWRDTKSVELPAALSERIEHWRSKLPDAGSVYPHYHGFEPYSYVCMFLGLGGIPGRASTAMRHLDATRAQREFELLAQQASRLRDSLPTHHEYLAQMY